MTDFDNNMRFALFINDKEDNPCRPDRTGSMEINGVEYKLSGWLKKDKNNQTYLSGTVQLKVEKASEDGTVRQPVAATDFDDDVPF